MSEIRMRCAGHWVRILGISLGVLGMAVVALGAAAEDAVAVPPEQAIASLNQLREAYGIPPVTLDQSLLKPECNWSTHEIASPGVYDHWSGATSPWDDAPYHELLLFDPSNVAAAYGHYDAFGQERGPWVCMWFTHDWGVFPGFYWAAEASGPRAVPVEMRAHEVPSSPAQDFGLPEPTGPNISLYAQGVKGNPVDAVSALVVSPSGDQVATHLKGVMSGLGGGRAMLVVDRPLEGATEYLVKVLWRGWVLAGPGRGEEPVDYSQSFSFTTAFVPKEITPLLKLMNGGRDGRRVRVWIKSDESLRGREAEVSVAMLQRRCGKQRRPPRPGCGWGTARRRERTVVLSEAKVPVYVPRPSRTRKLHIRASSKGFRFDEGVVKGATANLKLRAVMQET